MCYAPENDKEVFDLGVLDFGYYNIFITVFGEEELDLRVLGFAHINIFISINDKEDLEIGVLGRGRAGQIAIYHNSN